jgi:hypothetical protein
VQQTLRAHEVIFGVAQQILRDAQQILRAPDVIFGRSQVIFGVREQILGPRDLKIGRSHPRFARPAPRFAARRLVLAPLDQESAAPARKLGAADVNGPGAGFQSRAFVAVRGAVIPPGPSANALSRPTAPGTR